MLKIAKLQQINNVGKNNIFGLIKRRDAGAWTEINAREFF